MSKGAFHNRLTCSPANYLVLNRAFEWQRAEDGERVPLCRRIVAFVGKIMRRRLRSRHRRGALVRRDLHLLSRKGE